jgi:predicted ATP-grasp superfamily ATP-dependent carboligase
MRVFVFEYLSALAGGEHAEQGGGLHAEGWAMLSAVLEDFARCPGVEVVTLLGSRLLSATDGWPSNLTAHPLTPGEEEPLFRQLAREADCSLVIAPEFDDLLARRCEWVEEEGGRLLGPSSAAVRLTGDKLQLARHLQAAGIPTPASRQANGAYSFPAVCKPRHGAGSQATFLVRDEVELAAALQTAAAEGWSGQLIVQPNVPGRPVSVSFLCGPGCLLALPAAEQRLSADGRFHYEGGEVPLAPELDRRARQLAERAARTVPGLHGYFGVDLVLGDAEDVVIEINPRLTTSYVGLRRLACFNLAEALLAVARGLSPSHWEWQTGPVAFWPDGRIGLARNSDGTDPRPTSS